MALIPRVGQGVPGRTVRKQRATGWLLLLLAASIALNMSHAQEATPAESLQAASGDPNLEPTSQLGLIQVTTPATPAVLVESTDPPAIAGPAAATISNLDSTIASSPRIMVDRPRQRSQALVKRMEARLQAKLRSGPGHATDSDSPDTGSMAMNPLYQTILDKHNTYRSWHQVGGLTWNDNLASQAASYAAQCYFAHDPNANAGENLYATTDTGSTGGALAEAIDNWYNEVSSYNFNSPGWYPNAGHFTQVVWKSTTIVGCAVATCSNGLRGQGFSWAQGTYVVCRYSPAGNVIGQFQNNVFARSSTPPANPLPNPPPAPQPPPATPPPNPTPPPGPPPTTAFPPATLPAGYKYQSPGCLYSSNKRFRLCMQNDGKVVLYDAGRAWYPGQVTTPTAIWSTKAPSPVNPPYKITMQADGNLVASDVAGKVAWWTGAPNRGTAPYKMVVQDNGNVVVSDSLNQAMWTTNTPRG